jgi:hypothetical protein
MSRARSADFAQGVVAMALAVAALAFAATVSRAERDGAWGEVTLVPAPTVCANIDARYRNNCLGTAAAIALRR